MSEETLKYIDDLKEDFSEIMESFLHKKNNLFQFRSNAAVFIEILNNADKLPAYWQAFYYYREEKYTKALEICDSILEESPNDVQVFLLKAMIKDRTNKTAEAISYYEKAMTDKEWGDHIKIKLIISYRQLGEYEKSIEYGEKLLASEDFKLKEYARLQIAESMIENNTNLEKAYSYLKESLNKLGDIDKFKSYYLELGAVAATLTNYQESIEALNIYHKDYLNKSINSHYAEKIKISELKESVYEALGEKEKAQEETEYQKEIQRKWDNDEPDGRSIRIEGQNPEDWY